MDNKLIVIAILSILLLAGLLVWPTYAGLLLIFSLMLFGALALSWKEGVIKIVCLGALIFLCIANIGANAIKYGPEKALKFGIDFSGGTRIPVLLEKAVDDATMAQLIGIIKTRASVLGLTEVKVRAVGDSEIYVEVPGADEEQIAFIESVLSHQGVYLAVVDGKTALKGDDIYPHSIAKLTVTELQQGGGGWNWGVTFSITQAAAEKFATVVKGKAYYPVYMFIDRPDNAIVFLSMDQLKENAPEGASDDEIIEAARDAMRLEQGNLTFYIIEENLTIPEVNGTKAIISKDVDEQFKKKLIENGFVLREFEEDELKPEMRRIENYGLAVSKWVAIGLLDSPPLSPGVTEGKVSRNYQIGGREGGTGAERAKAINENAKRIESLLKGGSLPVSISLGSATRIPASLGSEFKVLSIMGIIAALVALSVFIGLRYRHLKTIALILTISLSELIILLAILGSFAIDLAAMAGILAAIGVGVDAQIVITDELLKKTTLTIAEKQEHAFAIIKTNVIVAILAMLPLLFSSLFTGLALVEIIGFSISTILGALLGYLLSRPAYSVLAEHLLIEK